MKAAIHAALRPLTRFSGTKKISRAHRPKGMAAFFIRGMRRPSLCRLLSEPAAISGSVTASMMWPTALIMPMMVSTPSTSRPCGMRSGMPDALEGW